MTYRLPTGAAVSLPAAAAAYAALHLAHRARKAVFAGATGYARSLAHAAAHKALEAIAAGYPVPTSSFARYGRLIQFRKAAR